MIKLRKAVIVEGKYDKIKLKNIIDAPIITTDGFGVFKNTEKRNLIKALAQNNGIVIITDSDDAGILIRNYLKGVCKDGEIVNVYLPQLKGKEKRKAAPSKQGFLGVEGISEDIIIKALNKYGVTSEKSDINTKKVSKTDLYTLGLSGKSDSANLRTEFSKHLNIPTSISCNSFLEIINAQYTYDEFFKEVEQWQSERGKN
ncbi:MAG: DUF4093 domain-containing protein [Clostridia bacterium]|nr:DUF4093 domain-containing protein [Clostridia bacterium]